MWNFIFTVAFTGVNTVTEEHLISTIDIDPPALHEVVPAEFKLFTHIGAADRSCRYHGVAIPIERDWAQTTKTFFSTTVNPPAPGKIYGYALFVNKKSCPDREDQPMFKAGLFLGALFKTGLPEGMNISFTSPDQDPAKQPKWLPQALTALQVSADAGTKAATDFLNYSKASATSIGQTKPATD